MEMVLEDKFSPGLGAYIETTQFGITLIQLL